MAVDPFVQGGAELKGYWRYFGGKLVWFLITLVFAFVLNFTLPRLMPGDPVAAIVARMAQGLSDATGVQAIYEQYTELFGLDQPVLQQFFLYVRNVLQGDFGFSISQYPRTVADVIASSIWWTAVASVARFRSYNGGWIPSARRSNDFDSNSAVLWRYSNRNPYPRRTIW